MVSASRWGAALLMAIGLISSCHHGPIRAGLPSAVASSHYLFVWAGETDKQSSDFLATVDVAPGSPTYGRVMSTLSVGVVGSRPHHVEYTMPAGGVLWANGFDSGMTFRFDLRDPTYPRLAGSKIEAGPFVHPHSYARLPSGNVLATFQRSAAPGPAQTGGLMEFDPEGRLVRSASAAVPAIDSGVRPYSLAVIPALDRVVTTSADMHGQTRSSAVQVWRLSDLHLISTILLPPGPRGNENAMTAEPRVLEDGRTVLVNTFTCGLYRVRNVATESPSAEWIYSTPWQAAPYCAVPVVAGHFWLQPSGPEHAVVVLDVADPARPREVGRLTLQPDEVPHWLALEPDGQRVVITGYAALQSRVLLARLNQATGRLTLDSAFTTPGAARPGVDFGPEQSTHGGAIPHGAVFSRP